MKSRFNIDQIRSDRSLSTVFSVHIFHSPNIVLLMVYLNLTFQEWIMTVLNLMFKEIVFAINQY